MRIGFRLFRTVSSQPLPDHATGHPEHEQEKDQSGERSGHGPERTARRAERRPEKILSGFFAQPAADSEQDTCSDNTDNGIDDLLNHL